MVLEECPTTRVVNKYWNEKIIDNFPVLANTIDAKFLSLKEYITERPQKFYNEQTYYDFLTFLTNFKYENPSWLVDVYWDTDHELNIAIISLNKINEKRIHDNFIPDNNIDVIRFIENFIHFNYLKLIEAVYHKYIRFIAYNNRLQRGKPIDGLDIYNCVEEVQKTKFSYTTTCYHNIIRNGIAHGGITFKESDTIYKGKRGKPYEIRTKEIIRMFDDLLDICNGFALAFKVFMILNRDFFQSKNLVVPKQLFIQELKAQANAPKWKVVDCLENVILDGKTQLNIFTENALLDFEEVNYYAFRTAVIAEYFASGFDRYFFSLKSKHSLLGWAGYDGKILKRERLKNSDDINGYTGVLEEDLLFFIPKIKLPKLLRKFLNILTITKSNFPIEYHKNTNFIFKRKYELRETKPFRRGFSIIINDPSLFIYPEYNEEIVDLIRKDYKKIVRYAIRKSKKEINSIIPLCLPTKYIRVTIYDTDLRKRQLRSSGLIDSLVCSITVNKSKRIKTIDLFGGKLEQKGKYRIVWNKNWKGIEKVY
ncbi:MAG: hypothetical protein IIA61_02100 [Candidatus Marinimicrobia bacterium]|nr:hypothetical protein [Candidatus Neomarinimicrobiota bacterium]